MKKLTDLRPREITKRDFETHIRTVIDKYIPVLFLQKHTFEVKFGTESDKSYFEFKFNYPYLNQTVAYSELAFKDWAKGKDIVPYIVHEISHCLTDPLYAKACERYASKNEIEDERERLTDLICNIVLPLTK